MAIKCAAGLAALLRSQSGAADLTAIKKKKNAKEPAIGKRREGNRLRF